MVLFFLSSLRWKRQSAKEDIYKMDKPASAEGKNNMCCHVKLRMSLCKGFHGNYIPYYRGEIPRISKPFSSTMKTTSEKTIATLHVRSQHADIPLLKLAESHIAWHVTLFCYSNTSVVFLAGIRTVYRGAPCVWSVMNHFSRRQVLANLI